MTTVDGGRFAAFQALHAPGRLLILPNAWDVASARLVEEAGALAIATTSAGLAWACGYPDGNALPPETATRAVASIARAIRVPLTVDVEAGYSDDAAAVARVVASVVAAGAAGINLEDGAGPPERLCAKIEAVRRAAADVFVNARIDVFLRGLAPAERAVAVTVERAQRYRAAGCDGIFVPGLAAPTDIRAVAAAVEPLPLNVMALPGLPPAAELGALGVRRLSAGAAIAAAAFGCARRLADAFLRDGRSDALFEEGGVEYGAMNALLGPPRG